MRQNPIFTLLSLLFLVSLSLADTASAATIYGNLYDLYLEKTNDVIVTINTKPQQTYVSKNGTYAFDAGIGNYEIKAEQYSNKVLVSYAKEAVSVKDNGIYVLDLILFPNLDEEIELGEDIDVDIADDYLQETGNNNNWIMLVAVVLFTFVLALLLVYYLKKNKKKAAGQEEKKASADDLDNVVKIIKEEGGRATQKDIRKKMPLSEAKISLMIAELEHKGIVEKIKKGRGNIVILKK